MDVIVDRGVLQVLLLAVMFLSIMVEIKTGGLGVGVLLGIVAAAVFWGSQYTRGLVEFYHIAVFLVGVLMIIVEILLPTVGLLAGLGVAAMLYSIVLALGGDIGALAALGIALVISVEQVGASQELTDGGGVCQQRWSRRSCRKDGRGAHGASSCGDGTNRWASCGCRFRRDVYIEGNARCCAFGERQPCCSA